MNNKLEVNGVTIDYTEFYDKPSRYFDLFKDLMDIIDLRSVGVSKISYIIYDGFDSVEFVNENKDHNNPIGYGIGRKGYNGLMTTEVCSEVLRALLGIYADAKTKVTISDSAQIYELVIKSSAYKAYKSSSSSIIKCLRSHYGLSTITDSEIKLYLLKDVFMSQLGISIDPYTHNEESIYYHTISNFTRMTDKYIDDLAKLGCYHD
jgi:hypothetical protein